jgi:cation diffusion facilitator CzcD-associated flavoprotein CzcO
MQRDEAERVRVIIVGGGAGGLSTAGALARRGIRSTVLDRNERIGESWSRRYRSLKLHTVRRFSGLAHHPISKDRPRYLSKDEYAEYLRGYADSFALDVALGNSVHELSRGEGEGGGAEWEVVTDHGTRRADVVVLATGHYAEPHMPTWAGIDGFRGELLHSSRYDSPAEFEGRRILVVGLGNSGAEIAAELAAGGASAVSVSVRTPPPIVTRELFGLVPIQVFGIALSPLRIPRLIDRAGAALRRLSIGDLSAYGLGPAAWGPFTARKPAVIDAGFLKQLKKRRLVVRPDIDHFEEQGVVYTGGVREPLDVVIAATGFRTGLERILRYPTLLDETGQPRCRSGAPTPAPGLYFIGFDETIRGHLYEICRESKQLALDIERYLRRVTVPREDAVLRARRSTR